MSRIRIAALLAALALIPAAAQAQTTITACYVPKTGSVYRIEATGAPEQCKSGHVEFSWTSPAVTYGPITTAGAAITLQPSAEGGQVAECPAGSVAISGGYLFPVPVFSPPDFKVMMNSRTAQGTGWQVYARNNSSVGSISVIVQAYCATVTQ